jgi:hypothetical protein
VNQFQTKKKKTVAQQLFLEGELSWGEKDLVSRYNNLSALEKKKNFC